MKKVFMLSFVGILSGCLLMACERNEGVRAGNDQGTDTYQPRPAPQTPQTQTMPQTHANQDIRGELLRVDAKAKTMTVRLANGVEQTFKVDDTTMVMGLDQKQTTDQKTGTNLTATRNLMGKEGSEVVVTWTDDGGAKTAAHINVVEMKTAKPKKR